MIKHFRIFLFVYYAFVVLILIGSQITSAHCVDDPWQARVCTHKLIAGEPCNPFDIGPTEAEKAKDAFCNQFYIFNNNVLPVLVILGGFVLALAGIKAISVPSFVRLSTLYFIGFQAASYEGFSTLFGDPALGFDLGAFTPVYPWICLALMLFFAVQTLRSLVYVVFGRTSQDITIAARDRFKRKIT